MADNTPTGTFTNNGADQQIACSGSVSSYRYMVNACTNMRMHIPYEHQSTDNGLNFAYGFLAIKLKFAIIMFKKENAT